MTSQTADILHICKYAWYDWAYYHDGASFPEDKVKLGKYLGPTHPGIGSVMAYHILPISGKPLIGTTI